MTITLKNVPPALHRSLKKQAKLNKRSLNQEALTVLEATVGEAERRRKAFEEIIRFRESLTGKGIPKMSQAQIRKAINEGRE